MGTILSYHHTTFLLGVCKKIGFDCVAVVAILDGADTRSGDVHAVIEFLRVSLKCYLYSVSFDFEPLKQTNMK